MKKIIVCLLIIFCNDEKEMKTYFDWNHELIDNFGIYEINDLRLSVYDDEKIVKYSLHDKEKNLLVESVSRASVYQSWYLLLDESYNLWFYSSDIGGEVWLKSEENLYKHEYVNFFNPSIEIPEKLKTKVDG
ncbi:MAG: hypothetical protein JJ971_13525 [Balneolaceae bacterium]|nr:hypothetical protein [Balneolaceae bacterium]MBO6547124.1 hypothetical protein [Balneolaceae bacterium]MBO6647929.1 hypothetical protein [Balneolaceae bacterium]